MTRQHGARRLSETLILRRGTRNPCAPTFVPHFLPPRPTQADEFSIAVPLASASKASPGFAPARCPRGPVEGRSGEAQRAQLPSRTGCLCTPSRLGATPGNPERERHGRGPGKEDAFRAIVCEIASATHNRIARRVTKWSTSVRTIVY